MILRSIEPLHADPHFVRAFAAVVTRNEGKVCAVCGLGVMGHAPESKWLGYDRHDWAPRAASASDLARAKELTRAAYRSRGGATRA